MTGCGVSRWVAVEWLDGWLVESREAEKGEGNALNISSWIPAFVSISDHPYLHPSIHPPPPSS